MTPQGDARGAVVHDCTSFSPDDNLVGPVLASFSFADCFASRALAQPRIAMSDRGMLRLSSDTVERSRGFLEEWMGLREGCSKEGTGITVEDPRKLAFSATFDNGTQLVGTAHEFHCMAHLLDLFAPKDASTMSVTHPIVFCPSNKIARRCLAIFEALAEQQAARAERGGDRRTADICASIVASHVYQSDVSLGGQGQSYERQQQRIWRFRGAERAVLFNVDLLSTGVDLPCCDCCYLLAPSKASLGAYCARARRPAALPPPLHSLTSVHRLQNSSTVLQRWGRALRLEAGNPDKCGTLALPCVDPYSPDEAQMKEWERFAAERQLAHNRREEFHQSEAEQTPSHTLAVAQGVLPCSSQALLSSAVSCTALWIHACQCSGGSLQVGVLVLVRRWRLLWVQTGHTRSICCRSRHRLQAGAQARERRQQGRGG